MDTALYRFFGGKTHPQEIGYCDVERFLFDLTITGKASVSTQRQALNSLVFLYRKVLNLSLDRQIQPVRSKKRPNLPTVLGKDEIKRFFRCIEGTHALMAKIMYGSGLGLMECVRLRIKDLDFDQKRIFVLQEIMGHADVKTTERYIHVMDKDISRINSPP